MRLATLQAAFGAAVLLLSAQPAAATNSHAHAHKRHGKRHTHGHGSAELVVNAVEKRTTCSLPNDPDLVKIPGVQNNGFAMSPDQSCDAGKYCPFACVPGKVMAQWEPNSTYTYPQSMVSERDRWRCILASLRPRTDWRRTVACIATEESLRNPFLTLRIVSTALAPSAL